MAEKIFAKSEDISLSKDLNKEMFFLLKILTLNCAVYYILTHPLLLKSQQGNPISDKKRAEWFTWCACSDSEWMKRRLSLRSISIYLRSRSLRYRAVGMRGEDIVLNLRSQTTLTRFSSLLTAYLPPCWHLWCNYFTVIGEVPLTFPVPPTNFVLSP